MQFFFLDISISNLWGHPSGWKLSSRAWRPPEECSTLNPSKKDYTKDALSIMANVQLDSSFQEHRFMVGLSNKKSLQERQHSYGPLQALGLAISGVSCPNKAENSGYLYIRIYYIKYILYIHGLYIYIIHYIYYIYYINYILHKLHIYIT